MSDTVAKDIVVGFEYVLKLKDGEEIDRSEDGQAMEYLHGHQNIVIGLERELAGLKVNDSKEVTVKPADGYGEYDPEGIQEHPRSMFPEDLDLEVDAMLQLQDPEGHTHLAYVKIISDDVVTLDMNHPLAGQTLHFSVKIVSLRAASEEELAHGHPHGPHGHH